MHWYRSKIDSWISALLCVPPLASLAVVIAFALNGPKSEWVWSLASVLLVAVIYFGLIFPMRYGIGEEHLHVRFGLVQQRIALSDISEVRPTRNPLSSPALSLDRLRVEFAEGLFGAVMISPADREQFLDELGRLAGLKREGDRLFRG